MSSMAIKKNENRKHIIMGLLLGALIFVIFIPLVIVHLSIYLSTLLGLRIYTNFLLILLGVILVLIGLSLAGWAAWALWKEGRGSPLPIAPTKKLVVSGPYAYTRNPMILGAFLYYTGLILISGALIGLVIVFSFIVLALIYVKFVEEKELERRLGEPYIKYKKSTPFFIPRPRRRKYSHELSR